MIAAKPSPLVKAAPTRGNRPLSFVRRQSGLVFIAQRSGMLYSARLCIYAYLFVLRGVVLSACAVQRHVHRVAQRILRALLSSAAASRSVIRDRLLTAVRSFQIRCSAAPGCTAVCVCIVIALKNVRAGIAKAVTLSTWRLSVWFRPPLARRRLAALQRL